YSRKDKSLGVLCSKFLRLYNRQGVQSIGLDNAAIQLGVERRRIYDIVNILRSVGNEYTWKGFTAIPHALQQLRKQSFNQTLKDSQPCKNTRKEKSLGLLTQNFIKLFISSTADLISLDTAATTLLGDIRDTMSDWSSKDVTVAMHSNIDFMKVKYNENITTQQQSSRNSKEFVFGPFTPAIVPKVGTSGNKKLKRAQDWENLADTYRPQYCNKALTDLFGHYEDAYKSWYVEADEKKVAHRSPES
ncbi:E2F transcription factor-like E2FF, partial [Bidens hawaiensis]|uniref:E2F transcription factor-like E2FF n=1 Tax=Bidens hawaiensis TaxID=980011 RepID=UPI00404B0BE8